MESPLRAPLEITFDYTRSLGPTLSRFATALAERRILGTRGSDGRVYAPPFEYDPVTFAPVTELVEVADVGTVVSWTWMSRPLPGQPLSHPFAWALITLDGADAPMLHAVDAGSPDRIHTGARVRVRWSDPPVPGIRAIECFVPDPEPPPGYVAGDDGSEVSGGPTTTATPDTSTIGAITSVITPIHLSYEHSVSQEESRYLRALAEGRLLGQRCPACRKVYIPPRGACPTDGVPTTEDVELPDTGVVTTFCVVNVGSPGQRITPPYVAAAVLLDGADIPFQHLILGCPAEDVRIGMRVQAVWRPRDEWTTTPENIDHFRPTGEPDAPPGSYTDHQ